MHTEPISKILRELDELEKEKKKTETKMEEIRAYLSDRKKRKVCNYREMSREDQLLFCDEEKADLLENVPKKEESKKEEEDSCEKVEISNPPINSQTRYESEGSYRHNVVRGRWSLFRNDQEAREDMFIVTVGAYDAPIYKGYYTKSDDLIHLTSTRDPSLGVRFWRPAHHSSVYPQI